MNQDITPLELRHKIRSGEFTSNNRPRHVTVRPSRGRYEESQMMIGLSLEPGFWFVAHARVGDALKAAKITGWRREEFGSSEYL